MLDFIEPVPSITSPPVSSPDMPTASVNLPVTEPPFNPLYFQSVEETVDGYWDDDGDDDLYDLEDDMYEDEEETIN
jgi:hypothetical protein